MRRRVVTYILLLLLFSTPLLAQESFLDLCKTGTSEQIADALKAGAKITERDNDGLTPRLLSRICGQFLALEERRAYDRGLFLWLYRS